MTPFYCLAPTFDRHHCCPLCHGSDQSQRIWSTTCCGFRFGGYPATVVVEAMHAKQAVMNAILGVRAGGGA